MLLNLHSSGVLDRMPPLQEVSDDKTILKKVTPVQSFNLRELGWKDSV